MEEREHIVSIPQLIVQVMDLPDEGINLEGSVPVCEFDLENDGRFSFNDAELRYRLHVALVQKEVIVTGGIEADVMAMCDRCAEWAPLHVADTEIFHSYTDETFEPVDLTEDIREDLVLMFPDQFLCKEDCRGICPVCGQNLNEVQCGCDVSSDWEDEESPWSALEDLEKKL